MVDVNLKVPAIEKLLDYAASGIGAVAGPMLLPWRAHWEGKAKRISARADADVRSIQAVSEAEALPIIAAAQAEARQYLMASDAQVRGELEITRDDVTQRIEFQERKRLANIRDVVAVAAEVLGDKEVDDHEPDPDWTARYFDYVQDVTSEDLKKLWARILAGEVEAPGKDLTTHAVNSEGYVAARRADVPYYDGVHDQRFHSLGVFIRGTRRSPGR